MKEMTFSTKKIATIAEYAGLIVANKEHITENILY